MLPLNLNFSWWTATNHLLLPPVQRRMAPVAAPSGAAPHGAPEAVPEIPVDWSFSPRFYQGFHQRVLQLDELLDDKNW